MIETTLKIEGMQCGMCETHLKEAVRKALPVKKVSASVRRKEMTILSKQPFSEEAVRSIIDQTGYTLVAFCQKEAAKKKGGLPFGK